MSLYVCIQSQMSHLCNACMYVCMHICMYVGVHMSVCMCICMYVCIMHVASIA